MNKKGLEFKSSFFAILVVGVLVISVGVILADWNNIYGSGITSDLGEFSKISEASSTVEEQKGSINPQSGEASSDFETETYRGAYGIITNIYAPLRIVFGEGGMIDSITDRFGIPDYIRQTLIAMIMFAITAAIIAIIFRRSKDTV